MQKTLMSQIILQMNPKTKLNKKTPWTSPREDFKFVKKMVGILKKWKIPKNPPQLQVIQPYSSSRT